MADQLYLEAIETFRNKFAKTSELNVREPAAMSLATTGVNGRPSVRTVLLRIVDERGFVFFTNSESRKGQQMAENPNVGLCFYWDGWAEQVHVEGVVEKVDSVETDQYWAKRAKLSRIGAIASQQSRPLQSHQDLMQAVAALEKEFADTEDVPRPEHWFGYRVVPNRIEFWNGREGRLHERTVYSSDGESWSKGLLYP